MKQTEGNGERERDGQRDTRRYRHEEKVGETETGRGRNRLLGFNPAPQIWPMDSSLARNHMGAPAAYRWEN